MEAKDVQSKEVVMLLKYMVQHNKSHNQELIDLLDNLKSIDEEAYKVVKEAIENYEKGNNELERALHLLEK